MHYLFFLPTGENPTTRPRCRHLLQYIQEQGIGSREYTIIISGRSSFQREVSESEAELTAGWLVSQGVDLAHIILETQALDTLGNVVLSHDIASGYVRKWAGEELHVVVITEGYHMSRVRYLVQRIWADMCAAFTEVSREFQSAPSNGRNTQDWQHMVGKLVQDLRTMQHVQTDLHEIWQGVWELEHEYAVDLIKEEVLRLDSIRYGLESYTEYRRFLLSLPVYRDHFFVDAPLDMQGSLYAHFVEWALARRGQHM